jgi:beta-glucosidase
VDKRGSGCRTGKLSVPYLNAFADICVQAWYQGQEQGRALSDVLLGTVNPCGKLPVTFPVRLEDNPSFYNYPGGNDLVNYGEGIFLGYRHYDMIKSQPLFPFGHGLSYTNFDYSNICLSDGVLDPSNGSITVTVDITNTGKVPGKEVVQFYISQTSAPTLIRPPRELKGFSKVLIEPGQTVQAQAVLDKVSVSFWDDKLHRWKVDANARFGVEVGSSSRDIRLRKEFSVRDEYTWIN